jgi:hypothetical protein
MNYYELLGVLPSASSEEIRQAYRELVEIHHPDRMQGLRPEVRERAEARLMHINEAYQVLRHAPERARYDAALAAVAATEVVFKPAGNPVLARSRLQAQISQIEREIGNANERIAALRPRMEGRDAADKRWERYLFVAILMGFPFVFAGQYLANLIDQQFVPTQRWVALGALILLGYLAMGLIMLISRVGLRRPGWLRLIGTAPLAAVVVAAVIYLNMPESFQLMAVAWGYVTIVWENAGKIVSDARDHIVSAIYSAGELEEKLVRWNIEKRRLQAELARL